MVKAPLLYDAQAPNIMQLVPLFKNKATTAEKLVGKLRNEAEEYRKEKKRNTLSGIHKLVKFEPVSYHASVFLLQYDCFMNIVRFLWYHT